MSEHNNKAHAPLLIFVRHGETDYNVQRRFQGQLPVELNQRGRQQATRVGQYLARLMEPRPSGRSLRCRRLLASDLPRAAETARLVAAQLPFAAHVELSQELREIDVGIFQGYTFEEANARHPEDVGRYMSLYENDPEHTAYPGGESRHHVAQRMLRALEAHARTRLPAADPRSHAEAKSLWADRAYWNEVSCEVWVSHGAALGILAQELGIQREKLHLGNTDCLVVGLFESGPRLLHHAEATL